MKKILISSIASILLCALLIAGSTFALFTSSQKVNVAVNSATVSISATVDERSIVMGSTLALGNLPETTAIFSATDNTITFDKIVPGDYVEFDIVIKNASNVAVDYRTTISMANNDGLWAGLEVTIDGVTYDGATATSMWAPLTITGTETEIVTVRIALPEAAGNEFQTKTVSLSYFVEAIQGNVY